MKLEKQLEEVPKAVGSCCSPCFKDRRAEPSEPKYLGQDHTADRAGLCPGATWPRSWGSAQQKAATQGPEGHAGATGPSAPRGSVDTPGWGGLGYVGAAGVRLGQLSLVATPCPRALRGPRDSQQRLPGAVPAAGSPPAQGPSDIHQTPACSKLLLCVLPGSKNQRVESRRRKRMSPAHMMSDPSARGRCA